MNYQKLGISGLYITDVTYGTALTIGVESSDQKYSDELIDEAWNLGVRSFDTSDNYGNAEVLLGKSLQRYNRQDFVVSSKGSWPIGEGPYYKGLSRKHIKYAFEKTYERLGLNYIDIYYAHRYDAEVPMEEIVRVYNELIRSGKILYWGTSEWPKEKLEECHKVCDELGLEKPIVEQFLYSYAVRKAENNGVIDFCKDKGVGTMGFSPLCQGLLTGKYKNGIPKDSRINKKEKINYFKTENFYEQNRNRIEKFFEICDKYNADYTSTALKFCLKMGVLPVLGASKVGQLSNSLNKIDEDITEELFEELKRN